MAHISSENQQIVFKLVYFGPGMSGKTTNLHWIHAQLAEKYRGELLVLDTEKERTLFFDFFPVSLGRVENYAIKFHLYTIPGQIHYEASRRLILEGADGVAFIADSRMGHLEKNIQSYRMMIDNMIDLRIPVDDFPVVLQYNKRDLEPLIELGSIERELGLSPGIPAIEAVASEGRGVMQTLRLLSMEVIRKFQL
ncbi:MAG: GTPase domain-containing protein [Candidatus Fermentibacter sp.]|nr:GTPase domain-containing protein [Candidatus Fermentibacter sp.]